MDSLPIADGLDFVLDCAPCVQVRRLDRFAIQSRQLADFYLPFLAFGRRLRGHVSVLRASSLKALEPPRVDQAVAKGGKVCFAKLGYRPIGNRIRQNRFEAGAFFCRVARFSAFQRFIFVTLQSIGQCRRLGFPGRNVDSGQHAPSGFLSPRLRLRHLAVPLVRRALEDRKIARHRLVASQPNLYAQGPRWTPREALRQLLLSRHASP